MTVNRWTNHYKKEFGVKTVTKDETSVRDYQNVAGQVLEELALMGSGAEIEIPGKRSYSRESKNGLWRGGETGITIRISCPATAQGIFEAIGIARLIVSTELDNQYVALEQELELLRQKDRQPL